MKTLCGTILAAVVALLALGAIPSGAAAPSCDGMPRAGHSFQVRLPRSREEGVWCDECREVKLLDIRKGLSEERG